MGDCKNFKAGEKGTAVTETKRGRGRPRKENSLSEIFEMRMTQEELNMLGTVADYEGLSRPEFLKDIIRRYFRYVKAVEKHDKR